MEPRLEHLINALQNQNDLLNLKNTIIAVVSDYFPKLIMEDKHILNELTLYLINFISNKFIINNYKQWTQNKNRDIKAVINLLLPYIDDKNNGYLLKKIVDLNQLLYAYDTNKIPDSIKNMPRDEILSTHFEFGNMGIGLLKNTNNDLIINNEKLIHKLIHHNFISLLKTISIINGKLYVNWLNIVPLNMNNYKNSILYTELQTRLTNQAINLNNFIRLEVNERYQGLWAGDIYNILINKYYYQVKKIKWLLFPYFNRYLVQILHNLLLQNLTNTFINKKFTQSDNDIFIQNLNQIKANLVRENIEVMKYTLLYFYNNTEINDQNLIMFKISYLDEDGKKDDYKKPINITNNDIILFIDYIILNTESFWNFLYDSCQALKHSAYGKFLIKDNILDNVYFNYRGNLHLKNIYNICKSLAHNNTINWIPNDMNYISLNNDAKIAFFEKVLGIGNFAYINSWINLKGNYARQYLVARINNYNNEMINLLRNFYNCYIDLVFEELVQTGILSEFRTVLELTDDDTFPLGDNAKRKHYKKKLAQEFETNKNDWENSYYYVTNNKYMDIKPSYFKTIINQAWYTFYAMDWICQINFFHHYINHQVLYITGATGQGKSTQVPKLLLYGLKMIDYKERGRIICTQPRIEPTVNNSERISDELGVPIKETKNNAKIRTNNYYVQYKYQKDSHINNTTYYNTLKICTDGSLFCEIIKNPTMRAQRKDGRNIYFTDKNVYDIIIVDEAHEHNINMDLILTLSRQSCYTNNSVRLIIVSATMDDDEPIYRRYFKPINDNLLYPIKCPIDYPIQLASGITMNNFFPNAKYMDRRYHISPPGGTTQYLINENYLDKDIEVYTNNILDDTKCAAQAQQKAYNIIIDICNKNQNGNILFFSNGQAEIIDAVKYLNQYLPLESVALPYFSKMNDSYKEIIREIDKKVKDIYNKKTNIYSEWGEEYIVDKNIQSGLYKRAVIIATNVAEASITIPNLEYVVDNGFAKVNKFIPEANTTELIVEKISESSRMQRRGRVGRIGSGTVYYMYKKNGRKSIKSKYKITQENISKSFLKILESLKDIIDTEQISNIIRPQERVKHYLVNNNFNPYLKQNLTKIVSYNINKTKPSLTYNDNYLVKTKYIDVIKKNYYICNFSKNNPNIKVNRLIPVDPSIIDTNTKMYEYDDETPKEFIASHLGVPFLTLLDRNGKYYLIHPFENDIVRNCFNDIIKYKDNKINIIPNSSYFYLLLSLINNFYIVDIKSSLLYQSDADISNLDARFYVKSEIGDIIDTFTDESNLTNYLEISEQDIVTLLAARALGCFDQVFEIIIFLLTINNSVSSIIADGVNFNKFYKIYNDHSDIISIYHIIQKFKKEFKYLFTLNKKYNDDTLLKKFIIEYDKSIYPPKYFNDKLWNDLVQLNVNNTLHEKFNDTNDKYNIVSDNYKDSIIKWCTNNYINSNTMIKFVDKIQSSKEIYNLITKVSIINQENFEKYDNNIEDKIIRAFIYGRPNQYAFKINTNDTLLKTKASLNIRNADYKKLGINYNTLTNRSYTVIHYLKYNIARLGGDTYDLSIISRIDPKWLLPANILLTHSTNFTKTISGDAYNRFMKIINDNWSLSNNVWNTPKLPILAYFFKNISSALLNI